MSDPTVVRRAWRDGAERDEHLVVEEPLEIRVEGRPLAVTMRTPGDDLELVTGFLLTEQVIDGLDDLAAIAHVDDPRDPKGNTVDVRLSAGVEAHRERIARATRELFASSACGVCGKASIDHLLRSHRTVGPLALDPVLIARLPDVLRAAQPTFARTGGLHGAGLFASDGTLEVAREDIGRHNAVDKVLGARLRAGGAAGAVPVADRVLVVSGRIGFEIVQKALVAGVPAIVAVGAPSSLAVDLAAQAGMALYGFVREGRATRYA